MTNMTNDQKVDAARAVRTAWDATAPEARTFDAARALITGAGFDFSEGWTNSYGRRFVTCWDTFAGTMGHPCVTLEVSA